MSLIKAEKTEKSAFALEFSVDHETFEATISKIYHKQVKSINIPGFRKGKAPRSVIERMYGKGVFYEDAANELLPGAYEAALKESEVKPVGRAEFDIKSIDENGIVFSAVVPVKPEVTVEKYKGIEAERIVEPVSDSEIDSELKVAQERNAREMDIVDAPAEMGESVKIDFEGSVDGTPFEGGQGSDYALKLGSGSFIPGFEDQVAGHSIGETFDVNVTFPDDYHASELAGKAAVFKTTIKSITKVELPELDDEFAKDVSEFDTFAEYREDLSSKILKRHEANADAAFEEAVVKGLIANLGGEEIPEAMYDEETENLIRNYDSRLRSQGLDLDTYLKYTGMNPDDLRKQFRPQAEDFVKTRLALEKIAELENVEVAEEDLEAEYTRLAEAYQLKAEDVKNMIPADSIKEDLKVKKAMELVKAAAVAPASEEKAGESDAE